MIHYVYAGLLGAMIGTGGGVMLQRQMTPPLPPQPDPQVQKWEADQRLLLNNQMIAMEKTLEDIAGAASDQSHLMQIIANAATTLANQRLLDVQQRNAIGSRSITETDALVAATKRKLGQ